MASSTRRVDSDVASDDEETVAVGQIWTPDRRLRVFISSTLGELAPERVAARAAIEALHLTPVLFELGARPHPPRALYAAYLEHSDIFVGIYWQRYGWVRPGAVISGLEDEYHLSSGMPRLVYVKEPAPDREAGLTQLLGRLEAEGSASYRRFETPEELGRLVADDLAVLLSERFGTPRQPVMPRPPTMTVPIPLTPTIGRRREIGAVAGLVRRGLRLITITGTGGVGKSRLAVMVALELGAEQRSEIHFVPLASVADPRRLLATIADHVRAQPSSLDPMDRLAERLAERPSLVVLDNFEHLAAAATDLAGLLDRCTMLQLLVTSRHLLRLRGEHEYALAPLDVPGAAASDVRKSDAVKLFVDRATAARAGFALTAENERAVAELCRRLDGLPLALELAAARLRLLGPAELLDRIGTRLDLLAGGAADLPEHQRALRATLDWSYNLLTPAEQELFARLSVFAGGATLATVEAVCAGEQMGDVLDVMASLLEKSLLVHIAPAAGATRFQMLHVVRAYASEKLAGSGEIELLRARHARWFLELVCAQEKAPAGDERWEVLDTEVDNIRSMLTWALDRADLGTLGILARALRPWWWLRGMATEALEWLEGALSRAGDTAPRSVDFAWIALALGHLQEQVGATDDAERHVRTALELFVLREDVEGEMAARLALAPVLGARGQVEEAVAMARETLERAGEARRDDMIEWAASILGSFLVEVGDLDGARIAHEEALDAASRLDARAYVAMAHFQLALIELMAHRREGCWKHLQTAAAIYRRAPHLDGVSYALEVAAAACLADRDVDDALAAAALAGQLRDALRLPVWPALRPLHDRLMAEIRSAASGDVPSSLEPWSDPVAVLERICEHHIKARS